MSTTANALYLPVGGHLVALDLFEDTSILPTFQANDRTRPESIQSDYSPEFAVPGTAHNHRLLRHAAGSQPAKGAAYVRLPCVLTSGGVEILPLGLLYVKGYQEGKYQLQLSGGNRRLVEALGDKTLADLDLSRFDHAWTPENILAGLPFDAWQTQGWGYELYDRGKPLDLQSVDPYTLYPSCSFDLVLQQLLTDAGFSATSLAKELFYAALNVPSANPYAYSEDYRNARALKAGYFFLDPSPDVTYYHHDSAFGEELLNFSYVSRKPYRAPAPTTGATYFAGRYTADTLGFYNIAASINTFLEINENSIRGKIRCKFQLKVNGQVNYDGFGSDGHDEMETDKTVTHTFNPKLTHYLLKPGDYVELFWNGDELGLASGTHWRIGATGSRTRLDDTHVLANEVQLTVELLPDFPPGGLVKLNEWLPDMKQLDFLKAAMLLLGLTIQCDSYTAFLKLTPGSKLPTNLNKAKDWTRKRDSFALPGRRQERNLAYRFGSYGQLNTLKWTEDEHVLAGYGDGQLPVLDEVLPASYELATLPFAATEASPDVPGLLRILNFEVQDFTATPLVYNAVEAKPRLVLRRPDGELSGQLVMVPADTVNNVPATLAPFTTTPSYFVGVDLSLDLNQTVLTTYWADLRAMLDEARYLTERYRLTPQDIAELDYSVPIWDGLLNDYFAVSQVREYDARRPVEVTLCRLNAAHLGPPVIPGEGQEFYSGEFYNIEWY